MNPTDRPTPETNEIAKVGGVGIWEHARQLERERDEAREERNKWKASHDNQVKLRRALMDRPDLGERARLVTKLVEERDKARAELAALREDKARLDWLNETITGTGRSRFFKSVFLTVNDSDWIICDVKMGGIHEGKDIRAALDAARKENA